MRTIVKILVSSTYIFLISAWTSVKPMKRIHSPIEWEKFNGRINHMLKISATENNKMLHFGWTVSDILRRHPPKALFSFPWLILCFEHSINMWHSGSETEHILIEFLMILKKLQQHGKDSVDSMVALYKCSLCIIERECIQLSIETFYYSLLTWESEDCLLASSVSAAKSVIYQVITIVKFSKAN